jgi:hypothetical protein
VERGIQFYEYGHKASFPDFDRCFRLALTLFLTPSAPRRARDLFQPFWAPGPGGGKAQNMRRIQKTTLPLPIFEPLFTSPSTMPKMAFIPTMPIMASLVLRRFHHRPVGLLWRERSSTELSFVDQVVGFNYRHPSLLSFLPVSLLSSPLSMSSCIQRLTKRPHTHSKEISTVRATCSQSPKGQETILYFRWSPKLTAQQHPWRPLVLITGDMRLIVRSRT